MSPRSADPALSSEPVRDPGSFRDPSGFVYRRDGRLLRQVNRSYASTWDRLETSGFVQDLVRRGWLIPFDDVPLALAAERAVAHQVIAPEPIDFISYPYEWTFGQLQDAALLTLDLETTARAAGFTLKDASAYNIQFRNGRPILIDTLSFDIAVPNTPWVAYRQFCQQFLAPLALMAYRDVRYGLVLRPYIDGLPLDLVSQLLPWRTRLRFGLLSHLHLHARAEQRFARRGRRPATPGPATMSDLRHAALIDSLRSAIRKLRWEPDQTEWADYADNTSYSAEAAAAKDAVVESMLRDSDGSRVWDLGANTGRFSRIAAGLGKSVVAFDLDAGAAELHYRAIRTEPTSPILPLVVDIANPSPGLGWAGRERRSLADRANADVILALALVHHLAIGRNVPLADIADWFAQLAAEVIIEFVPKSDPMVVFLLSSREDVFANYTLEGFRAAMATRFEVVAESPIEGSRRVLFHLRRRTGENRS